jgi:hypothetical protein
MNAKHEPPAIKKCFRWITHIKNIQFYDKQDMHYNFISIKYESTIYEAFTGQHVFTLGSANRCITEMHIDTMTSEITEKGWTHTDIYRKDLLSVKYTRRDP